jgi:hypothetical protein
VKKYTIYVFFKAPFSTALFGKWELPTNA